MNRMLKTCSLVIIFTLVFSAFSIKFGGNKAEASYNYPSDAVVVTTNVSSQVTVQMTETYLNPAKAQQFYNELTKPNTATMLRNYFLALITYKNVGAFIATGQLISDLQTAAMITDLNKLVSAGKGAMILQVKTTGRGSHSIGKASVWSWDGKRSSIIIRENSNIVEIGS